MYPFRVNSLWFSWDASNRFGLFSLHIWSVHFHWNWSRLGAINFRFCLSFFFFLLVMFCSSLSLVYSFVYWKPFCWLACDPYILHPCAYCTPPYRIIITSMEKWFSFIAFCVFILFSCSSFFFLNVIFQHWAMSIAMFLSILFVFFFFFSFCRWIRINLIQQKEHLNMSAVNIFLFFFFIVVLCGKFHKWSIYVHVIIFQHLVSTKCNFQQDRNNNEERRKKKKKENEFQQTSFNCIGRCKEEIHSIPCK